MAITIAKNKSARGILKQVQEISGVDLSACYQCKKCTSGCPVSNRAECPPSEMMRRLHLGMGDELLDSDILWMCVSCETCSTRCPICKICNVKTCFDRTPCAMGSHSESI